MMKEQTKHDLFGDSTASYNYVPLVRNLNDYLPSKHQTINTSQCCKIKMSSTRVHIIANNKFISKNNTLKHYINIGHTIRYVIKLDKLVVMKDYEPKSYKYCVSLDICDVEVTI